jgi:hypothetical protein
VTGYGVDLRGAWRLPAGAGAFGLIGQAIDSSHGHLFVVVPGAFEVAGGPAVLQGQWRIAGEPGTFQLVGYAVGDRSVWLHFVTLVLGRRDLVFNLPERPYAFETGGPRVFDFDLRDRAYEFDLPERVLDLAVHGPAQERDA